MLSESDWLTLDLLDKCGTHGMGYDATGFGSFVKRGWAETFKRNGIPMMRITEAGRKALGETDEHL